MTRYLLRRTAASLLLLFALLSAVFFLSHLAPGDPVAILQVQELDAADREALRESLGLNAPLHEQYLDWLRGVLTGDLGRSLRTHRPVSAILGEAAPRTLLLTGVSYVVHLAAALALGVWMERRRGTRSERWVSVGGLAVYSLPAFWLGLMLILLFSRVLGWLPAGGMQAPDHDLLPLPLRLLDTARHLVLPVVVLGLSTAVGTARYLRNTLQDVLQADFITAARARGLSERAVIWRHGVRNALLPVVTLAGLNLPFLVGGAVVTETVFAWPGMGRETVAAIAARDYPVVLGATALAAVAVVLGNLLADVAYGFVDPRIRLERGGRR